MAGLHGQHEPPDKVAGDFLELSLSDQLWVARQVVPQMLQNLDDAEAAQFLQNVLAEGGKENLAAGKI